MKLLLLLFCLLFVGCNTNFNEDLVSKTDYEPHPACAPEFDKATFVLTCIKDANPYSDEEPEDMVSGCVKAARKVCPKVPGFREDWHVEAQPCSIAWLSKQMAVCAGQPPSKFAPLNK